MTPAELLSEVAELGLKWWRSVLLTPVHMLQPWQQAMWIRAKNQAANHVMTARLRVDDRIFHEKQDSLLPELLRRMAEAARNPRLLPPNEVVQLEAEPVEYQTLEEKDAMQVPLAH